LTFETQTGPGWGWFMRRDEATRTRGPMLRRKADPIALSGGCDGLVGLE
jgi:hypothetical protein